MISFPLNKYPEVGIARLYGSSTFNFFEEPPYCFPQCLHKFIFPPTVHKGPLFSTFLPAHISCLFDESYSNGWAFLVARMIKNLPAVWKTWVRSLGWKGPLEEGMATYSNILAWRIPMDRGAWRVTKSQTRLSN